MKRALALALAALVLLPGARAATTEPLAYPSDVAGLLPKWISAAETAGANDTTRPWFHEAEGFLKHAKDMAAAGRVRTTIFDLESYHELRVLGELLDAANASAPTVGEQKAFIANALRVARSDGNDSWSEFRRELHVDDSQIHSLRAAETALYAADIALTAKNEGTPFDALMSEFIAAPTIDRGYVLGLIHGAHTVSLDVGFARDILATAGAQEGLPPRILDANWTALSRAVTNADGIQTTATTKDLEALAQPARRNNETLLSVAFSLAEQRAARAAGIQQIYGDAKGRVGTVLNDLSRNMGKQLANTTLDAPRGYGMLGLFTADAVDRALLAKSLADSGEGNMGSLIAAWAALDHANYAIGVLGAASPVHPAAPTPAVPTPHRSPDLGAGLLVGGALLVALAVQRRR